MTVLFFDGFDHYALSNTSDFAQKWVIQSGGFGGGDTFAASTGRVVGNAVNMLRGVGGGNGAFSMQHNINANYAQLGIGFGYKPSATGGLAQFWDGSTTQLSITHDANGQILVDRGNAGTTTIASSSLNVLTLNLWQFVEIQAVFAGGTSGSVKVAVNGTTVITGTGLNTISSANAYANQVSIFGLNHAVVQAGTPGNNFDDFFLLDISTGTGSGGSFFGDHRVLTQLPTGNSGDTSGHDQWTQVGGTGGSFWTSVNDNPHDSDTSYVVSTTAGQIENFTHAALPATVTGIVAVQFNLESRKDDVGTRTIAATQRNSTTDSVGTTSPNLSQTYQNFMQLTETSLQTATAWTISEWNASEFGAKLIS